MVPGLTTSRETYEAEYRWGSQYQGIFANALIDGATVDSGNSPTHELRPGLLLGQIISTGKWKQYSPTATDGSEVANGVLIEGLRMQDFSGANVDRFYAILVGGPVQATKLLNLDLNARQQMDKFFFDDIFALMGNHWYPWKRFQSKSQSYTLVANDNFSHFNNVGAIGAITFTLPPIANGYLFMFHVQVDQNMIVASSEGANMIALNNASANSVAFQTGSAKIGGSFHIYSNSAGTKWIVENSSAGANTITVA